MALKGRLYNPRTFLSEGQTIRTKLETTEIASGITEIKASLRLLVNSARIFNRHLLFNERLVWPSHFLHDQRKSDRNSVSKSLSDTNF